MTGTYRCTFARNRSSPTRTCTCSCTSGDTFESTFVRSKVLSRKYFRTSVRACLTRAKGVASVYVYSCTRTRTVRVRVRVRSRAGRRRTSFRAARNPRETRRMYANQDPRSARPLSLSRSPSRASARDPRPPRAARFLRARAAPTASGVPASSFPYDPVRVVNVVA